MAYKSVGEDPYLKGMQRKIETDLVCEERIDMQCRQNVDDGKRQVALAGGSEWWPSESESNGGDLGETEADAIVTSR